MTTSNTPNAAIAQQDPVDAGQEGSTAYVTLEAVGLTLVGVLVNLGVTVGLAVHGPWFARVGAGIATPAVVALLIKGTHARAGVMKRLADWLTH